MKTRLNLTLIFIVIINYPSLALPTSTSLANQYLAKPPNNMHADAKSSNTTTYSGPLTQQVLINQTNFGLLALCPTVVFNQEQTLITACPKLSLASIVGGYSEWLLYALEPKSLKILASYSLPKRYGTLLQQSHDTSGGAYFILDHNQQVIVGTANRTINHYSLMRTSDNNYSWQLTSELNLKPYLNSACVANSTAMGKDIPDNCSKIITVMPDDQGQLWFNTNDGYIGYVTPTQQVISRQLSHIELGQVVHDTIIKGLSHHQNIIYAITDYGLYALTGLNNQVTILWQQNVAKADQNSAGGLGLGSNTTPVVFGNNYQYVAVADRANSKNNQEAHALIFNNKTGQLLCQAPTFTSGKTLINNSFIGYENSIIVVNNYGATSALSPIETKSLQPGIMRIEIRKNSNGEECVTRWQRNDLYSTATPRLSTTSGLIYGYFLERQTNIWQLQALDYASGQTVLTIPVGKDKLINSYNNHWGIVTLGPNNIAYVGFGKGLLAISPH